MWFVFTYTAAFLTLLLCALAVFLFFKKRTSILAAYLRYLLLADALWIGSNAAADISSTPPTLIFWGGMAFIGGCLFVSFFLSFLDVFIYQKHPSIAHLIAYFTPTIFFALFAFSHYSIAGTIFPQDAPAQVIPGFLYNLFPLFLFGSIIYGTIRLKKHYPTSSRRKKKQIIYISLGFLAVITGGLFFNVILPLFGEFRFGSVGPQMSIIMFALTVYAIFKHKLLDIKIVLQLGIIYTITTICIIAFYLFTLFITLLLFQNTKHTTLYFSSSLITTLIGIWSVPTIERYLRTWTDHIFFKDKYDFPQAMQTLSEITRRYLHATDITDHLKEKIQKILKVRFVFFDLPQTYGVEITPHSYSKQPAMTIPITAEGGHIGTMLIGPKLSGDEFTSDDIQLLKTISHSVGLALEKAKLYAQLIDYSKNLEKKVIERTQELKGLQEQQAQMMIDISHELQTPLTIMKGELTMLRSKRVPSSTLVTFEKTIDRISRFISTLLKIAKLEADIDREPHELVNLSSILHDQIEYIQVLCEQQDITLATTIEPNIFVHGHHDQIGEVIINIMSNAVKYIANTRHITVTLYKEKNQAILTIADTGIGIPEDMIPHLFQRFYRSSGQVQTISGTGLGLALCEKIITAHQGTIDIASTLHVGTTVTIRLPIQSSNA